MINPIADFCEALRLLPNKEKFDALIHCDLTLGISQNPADPPDAPHRHPAKLDEVLTVEQVEKRLMHLCENEHVAPSLLINGMILNFISEYEQLADANSMADAIDRNLSLIQILQDDLTKPLEERTIQEPDEDVRAFLEQVKLIASNVPKDREMADRMRTYFKKLQEEFFTKDYWDQFIDEQVTSRLRR